VAAVAVASVFDATLTRGGRKMPKYEVAYEVNFVATGSQTVEADDEEAALDLVHESLWVLPPLESAEVDSVFVDLASGDVQEEEEEEVDG